MIYTVTRSKDPDMYEFWNEHTVAGKKQPMLCFVAHCDCLTSSITQYVNDHGDIEVEFDIVKES